MTPGWHQERKEGLAIHYFQSEEAWRGVGVAFPADKWTIMRKRACGRAVWFRLRRLGDGTELWLGSAHHSQEVASAVHQHQVNQALRLLPPTGLPTILGMDANAAVGWTLHEQHGATAVGTDAKSNLMIGTLEYEGYRIVPPSQLQFHTPRSRPRKAEARGPCIDVMAAKHVGPAKVEILVDSHKLMDTDHDMVVAHVMLRASGRRYARRMDTRARVVTSVIPPQPSMDQETLKRLAVSKGTVEKRAAAKGSVWGLERVEADQRQSPHWMGGWVC